MIATMLPIKHQSIFKSRWMALLWAGGIIWSAVEFTGSQPGATDNNQASPDESAPASGGDDPAVAALTGAINTVQGLK
jgi:hypothetical protein